jgi:hypothetical protein
VAALLFLLLHTHTTTSLMDDRPTRKTKHLRRSRSRNPARQARSQHARKQHDVKMKDVLQKVLFKSNIPFGSTTVVEWGFGLVRPLRCVG